MGGDYFIDNVISNFNKDWELNDGAEIKVHPPTAKLISLDTFKHKLC